jgi:hypothetical protein
MKRDRELGYYEGIIEGRLIERGFFAIGDNMFQAQKGQYLIVISFPSEIESTIEVFYDLPKINEEGIEARSYIKLCREEAMVAHNLRGHIEEIVEIAKVLGIFYSAKEAYDATPTKR